MKDQQLMMSKIDERSTNGMLTFDMGDGIIATVSLENATLVFSHENGQPVIDVVNSTVQFHLEEALSQAA